MAVPWNIRPGANLTVGVALLPDSPAQVTVKGEVIRDNETILSREMVFEKGKKKNGLCLEVFQFAFSRKCFVPPKISQLLNGTKIGNLFYQVGVAMGKQSCTLLALFGVGQLSWI